MKRLSRIGLVLLALACFPMAAMAAPVLIIADEFDDGDPTTNTSGTGTGFAEFVTGNAAQLAAVDFSGETGGVLTRVSDAINGAATSRYESNDAFAADAPGATTSARWTFTDFSRGDTRAGSNGRMAFGLLDSAFAGAGTTPYNTQDGLWIAFNSDQDPTVGVGIGGLSYIDGATVTELASWSWDDNGLDVPNGTLIDFSLGANDHSPDDREDRVIIDMIAPDLTVLLELVADSWSLSFSSTDPTAVLPPGAAGTFSGLGLTNDLSSAKVAIFSQGAENLTWELDRLLVTTTSATADRIPEPATMCLLGLGALLALRRRRSR